MLRVQAVGYDQPEICDGLSGHVHQLNPCGDRPAIEARGRVALSQSTRTRLLHRIMDQEDRRAPRAPIRAARQLHTRGDPSTPSYMNWDGTDGVWRNDRG
eukprot:scaffold2345_cov50-Phaeocystis_antarctica.AAC.2